MIADSENSKTVEMLADAEKAIVRAKDLTQQLLTFSKGGEPIKKTFCIKELLSSTAFFAIRGANVKCKFKFPVEPCTVEADEGQLVQVINNLVINADQAMPDGGIITICTENHSIDNENGILLAPGN